jgi:hypothetical protein
MNELQEDSIKLLRYALWQANLRLAALEQPKPVTVHFKSWRGDLVVLQLPLQHAPNVGDVVEYDFDSGELDGATVLMRVVQVRHSCHPGRPPLTVVCEATSP